MKKILCVLAVFVLFTLPALAEGFDLSSMSLEELISLYQQIGDEISDRVGLAKTNRIGRGSYVVGKDIQSGYYDFVCLETGYFDSGTPDNDIYIYLLVGDTAADIGDRVYWEQRFEIGAHVTFNLEEGTLLEIEGCSGELTPIYPEWIP